MAWVYKPALWIDGDILTIEEVNEELRHLVGEMNGHIDRDNLDSGEVTHAKFKVDTFNEILWIDGPTSSNVTVDVLGKPWQVLASGSIVTEDGRLSMEAHYSYDFPGAETSFGLTNQDGAEVGIRLNGEIVSRSGFGGLRADTVTAVACPAVGAGTQYIELVARYVLRVQYDHKGGGLLARYVRR